MTERRAHPRFACDLRVRVELPDGQPISAQAADVSFSGICVHAEDPLAARTRVRFHLWVALPERDSDEFALPGRIVWCTAVEGRFQLGAAFDRDMDNYAWTRLDALLQLLASEPEPAEIH